jgi:hypothetical protein
MEMDIDCNLTIELLGSLTQIPWQFFKIGFLHKAYASYSYRSSASSPPLTLDSVITNKHPELFGRDLTTLFQFERDKIWLGEPRVYVYEDYLVFYIQPETVQALKDLQEAVERHHLMKDAFKGITSLNHELCKQSLEGRVLQCVVDFMVNDLQSELMTYI